eukprot:9235689-Pyramimonas_sp.AAC.1
MSPDDLDLLVMPTPAQIRKVASRFKVRTSVGCDWLHPRHVAQLSDDCLRCPIALWRTMLRLGRPPTLLSYGVMSLIPKDTSDRPVACFATTVRILLRWLRRTYGQRFSGSTAKDYLFGTTGKSSLACVWRQAVMAEVAHARGWASLA